MTYAYDFEAQRRAWSKPPVDDADYMSSSWLLTLPDDELRALVDRMTHVRYDGWRNYRNLWVSTLKLSETYGKTVVDFGCGVGVEALRYAQHGNRVILVDIVEDNVRLAERVLALYGYPAYLTCVAGSRRPYVDVSDSSVDVVHCSGVLHHIPYARDIVEDDHRVLRPGGELRLMLYSDEGWRRATDGSEPPVDVTTHPRFTDFVRFFDQVGTYADWYDRNKIDREFGDLFEVTRFSYLTETKQYLAATLERRNL